MKKDIPSISKPSPLWMMLEAPRTLALWANYSFNASKLEKIAPRGDGHPVFIIPGLMASQFSTRFLRSFLQKLGYQVNDWGLGRNLGNFERIEKRLDQNFLKVYEIQQEKITIIGWSLGGVYARHLAKKFPEKTRQAITMGSPFLNLTDSNNAVWLYEALNGKKVTDLPKDLLEKMQYFSLPMPTTSIFSKTDGIVDWKACLEDDTLDQKENIEVQSSHAGLGSNLDALLAIADRLSLKEGHWRPYRPSRKLISKF